MKKAGCILLLALPTIAYLYTVYSGASRFEASTKTITEKLEEADRRRTTPKPATFAEARRLSEEKARQDRAADTAEIEELLKSKDAQLARQAAAQVAGEEAGRVTCRAVARSSTQQSESSAWWTVDFECLWAGDRLPNKTSISVRLAKKGKGWMLD